MYRVSYYKSKLNWCSDLDTYFFRLFLYINQETFIKKKLTKGFLTWPQQSCGREWFEIIFIFCEVPVRFLVFMRVWWGFFVCLFSLILSYFSKNENANIKVLLCS